MSVKVLVVPDAAHPRCLYCGAYIARGAITCEAHRDLPSLDPELTKARG